MRLPYSPLTPKLPASIQHFISHPSRERTDLERLRRARCDRRSTVEPATASAKRLLRLYVRNERGFSGAQGLPSNRERNADDIGCADFNAVGRPFRDGGASRMIRNGNNIAPNGVALTDPDLHLHSGRTGEGRFPTNATKFDAKHLLKSA
jgi:hypothetical protein